MTTPLRPGPRAMPHRKLPARDGLAASGKSPSSAPSDREGLPHTQGHAPRMAFTLDENHVAWKMGLRREEASAAVSLVRQGLPSESLEILQEALAIPMSQLAVTVGIPLRTLARRKGTEHLKADESDRVLRLARLFDLATHAFQGDSEGARLFFRTPLRALAGETPLSFAQTEPGAREIEDLLGRFENGVLP